MLDNGRDAWYAAFKAKDARFDGRFFVAVFSTGIYCRPICPAKLPKLENCSFHRTAASAEQAGYRPCLRCRPELAPGNAPVDASASLARRAARLIEENCGSDIALEGLASQLNCTDRHLRRVFVAEFSVTPIQYRQTCRLLLAKNLLTDTELSVVDVAMASGFGSLRRFNAVFKNQYRLAPTALRRQKEKRAESAARLNLALGYRPPYQWDAMLAFLASRAIPGVEVIKDNLYARAVALPGPNGKTHSGWIRVWHLPQRKALNVEASLSLLPVLSLVLARVRHLFDLGCDPQAVHEALVAMNDLKSGLQVIGTRLPGSFDPFEMAVRAVLGQQITVGAARTLAARMVSNYGTPVQTAVPGLSHAFPPPARILSLEGDIESHLGPLGIIRTRARTIRALAQALVAHDINFGQGVEPACEVKKLLELPGIGPWTAHYIAMRAMAWPDAFLPTDYGVKKALAPRTPRQISTLAQEWSPWRSYATINLWNSLH
ncbi:AlkA N-terminal domain-containing protein [Paraburkholderia rhizosphaerae]|uniref:DNA-3-methyladenine glycosylase II n=1 Tax=Paraburkholderia rhizosphaerae TaxID=480658 RepID=A0A4R8LTH0_9BURK|nr:AlkA N-terminal domain-containing protein [Paraburkholderia rhizosphaerae]TDY50999.1 DNA-3-methyladenine glycosylase II [Paraburkholderia rhizosphaerae]